MKTKSLWVAAMCVPASSLGAQTSNPLWIPPVLTGMNKQFLAGGTPETLFNFGSVIFSPTVFNPT